RPHDERLADAAARARPVLDEKLLAEKLAQLVRDDARGQVIHRAGAGCDDDLYGLGRIRIRGERAAGKEMRRYDDPQYLRQIPPELRCQPSLTESKRWPQGYACSAGRRRAGP